MSVSFLVNNVLKLGEFDLTAKANDKWQALFAAFRPEIDLNQPFLSKKGLNQHI